jgi:hypothetical protein
LTTKSTNHTFIIVLFPCPSREKLGEKLFLMVIQSRGQPTLARPGRATALPHEVGGTRKPARYSKEEPSELRGQSLRPAVQSLPWESQGPGRTAARDSPEGRDSRNAESPPGWPQPGGLSRHSRQQQLQGDGYTSAHTHTFSHTRQLDANVDIVQHGALEAADRLPHRNCRRRSVGPRTRRRPSRTLPLCPWRPSGS